MDRTRTLPRAAAAAPPVLALLALLALLPGAARADSLQVGVLLTETGTFAERARETRVAGAMWEEHVAATGGIGGTGLGVNLTYVDVGTNATLTAQATADLMDGVYGPVPDLLMAPYGSTLTPVAAEVAEERGVPIVSGGAASETVFVNTATGARRFEWLYSLISPATVYLLDFLSIVRVQGGKTVALLRENATFTRSMCDGARQAAADNRVEVVYDAELPRIRVDSPAEELQVVYDHLEAVRRLAPDALVGCTYADACQALINRAHEIGYTPKAIAVTVCIGSAASEAALGDRLAYVFGPSQWDARLKGRQYQEDPLAAVRMFPFGGDDAAGRPPSPEQFAEAYEAKYAAVIGGERRAPSYQAASALGAMYAMQAAVTVTNGTDPDEMRNALQRMYENSFFGLLAASRFGANEPKGMVLWQYGAAGGAAPGEIVSPIVASTRDVVWPMPTWEEREYVRDMYSTTVEQIAVGVVITISVLCLGVAAFIVVRRNLPVFRAASVPFSVASVMGSIATTTSVLTWPLDNNDHTCAARPWAFGMGFAFVIVPLLSKTLRVYRIFSTNQLSPVSLRTSNAHVAAWAGVLAAPLALLLLAWSAVAPLSTELVVVDPDRPSKNYHRCSGDYMDEFAYAMVSYIVALLAALLFLAFRTRNVWDAFNDARQTSLAAYNYVFCGCVLGMVMLGDMDRETEFAIRSFLLVLAGVSTTAVLFVPKIVSAIVRPDWVGDRKTTGTPPNKTNNTTVDPTSRLGDRYASTNPSSRTVPQEGTEMSTATPPPRPGTPPVLGLPKLSGADSARGSGGAPLGTTGGGRAKRQSSSASNM